MRFSYHPDTDSLYIELNPKAHEERPPYVEGERGSQVVVSEGMVIDVDKDGRPVGIDVHSFASEIFDLTKLEAEGPIFGLVPAEGSERVE